jgi:hypothetical protein
MNVLHLVCPVHGEQQPRGDVETYQHCRVGMWPARRRLCDLPLQPVRRIDAPVWGEPVLWRRGHRRGRIRMAD